MLPENFANHPKSVGEIRSERERNGALWTPRDALIDVLRKIDSGEVDAESLVIVYRQVKGPGRTTTGFATACIDVHVSLGLLADALYDMSRGD